MLVIGGSESLIEVRGLAKYPSHGGSQGFKSPHRHPTTALVTGLAECFRRSRSPGRAANGQQLQQNGQPLLDCGQETERSGHVPDLPITRRTLGVNLDSSRRNWLAHVGCLVGPDRSRRVPLDHLDDQRPGGFKKSSVTSLVLREQASVGLLSARARRGLRGPADQTGGEGQDQDGYRSRTEEGGRILVRTTPTSGGRSRTATEPRQR